MNLAVAIAGQIVNPGDVVVGDDDGVVVVPRTEVKAVIAACKAREEKEAGTRAQLAAGKLGLDIYGFRDKLKAKGLKYT